MKSPLYCSPIAACAAVLAFALLAALTQSAEVQEKKNDTEQLLQAELNKFWSDESGWSQLHWAALPDDGEAIRHLLDLGMIASPRTKGDNSAFSGERRRLAGLLGKDASRWKNSSETLLLAAVRFKSLGEYGHDNLRNNAEILALLTPQKPSALSFYWRNLRDAATRLALAGFASEAHAQQELKCSSFKPLVMGVWGNKGWGSASIYNVDKDQIITSYHVVDGHNAEDMEISAFEFKRGRTVVHRIRSLPVFTHMCRKEHDMCILEVPHLSDNLKDLGVEVFPEIGDANDLENDDPLCSCGVQGFDKEEPSVICLPTIVVDSKFHDLDDLKQPRRGRALIIHAGDNTNNGQSGGPIVNKNGEIVGLVTKEYSNVQDVYVPINWATLMAEVDCDANDAQSPPCETFAPPAPLLNNLDLLSPPDYAVPPKCRRPLRRLGNAVAACTSGRQYQGGRYAD